ncbi:hypothetical protein ACOSP7_031225 [Xanthoceras sorbifolium]
MTNVIPLDDFEIVLGIEFFVKANEKLANSAERKYNKALDRGKCVATLEAKSGFVAESVGFVDELQLSIASNSGLVEFQRKLSDCSSIGMGPKQQMKHDDGSVTVG